MAVIGDDGIDDDDDVLAFGGHIGVTNAASLLDSILVENADGSGQLAIVHIRLQDVLGISGLGILLGLRRHHETE